jgi:hypothetical protein
VIEVLLVQESFSVFHLLKQLTVPYLSYIDKLVAAFYLLILRGDYSPHLLFWLSYLSRILLLTQFALELSGVSKRNFLCLQLCRMKHILPVRIHFLLSLFIKRCNRGSLITVILPSLMISHRSSRSIYLIIVQVANHPINHLSLFIVKVFSSDARSL